MNPTDLSTHRQASGARGDVLAAWRLVGEPVLVLKDKIPARWFGVVAFWRECGPLDIGSQEGKKVSSHLS